MFFQTAIDNRVLHLVFADPATRNSLSVRAAEELLSSINQHQGQFDAICFRAEGRVFCSGGNLADYGQMANGDQGRVVNVRISEILQEVANLLVPTFCLVEGDCFGGGVELISAFDFVYSVPHAFFGLWQRRVALTYGWGGGARIAKRVGDARMKQLAISAVTMSALHARDYGLIDGLSIRPEQLFHQNWSRMAKLPAGPVAGFKRWSFENESAVFDEYWWSADHRDRLEARKRKS